ncbi:MAG: DNA replication and repair protein RecF [candidate division Zixibacteria bacterium]|nr:DNA replication and repair protein RecF [candidate division Zixibacteria bacterium]
MTSLNILSLENFRNLENSTVNFSPGVNIFCGQNGSGKTNLLEAIMTVCLGRSQRLNASDRTLVNTESDWYRLEGNGLVKDHKTKITVAFQKNNSERNVGKKVTLNNAPSKLSELFQMFSVITISPEDSDTISGVPSLRRRFLDFHLSQSSPTYLDNLTKYHRVLAQRNIHIKNSGIPIGGTTFDELLIDFAAMIIKSRLDYLTDIREGAQEIYSLISGGGKFECVYNSSAVNSDDMPFWKSLSGDEKFEKLKSSISKRLTESQEAERAREITLVGPHRDDIAVKINSLSARSYASQGEWRSAAVALKLATYKFLKENFEKDPILLLDEVFAELDENRQAALVNLLTDVGQVFLTSAIAPPENLRKCAAMVEIVDGRIKIDG